MSLEPSYAQFNFLADLGDGGADAVDAGFQECSLTDRHERAAVPGGAGTLTLKRGIINRLSLSRWLDEEQANKLSPRTSLFVFRMKIIARCRNGNSRKPGSQLRRERMGGSDGRVYLIHITATDQYNNSSLKVLRVGVAKSMGPSITCGFDSRPVAGSDAPDGGFFATSPPAPIIGPKQRPIGAMSFKYLWKFLQ